MAKHQMVPVIATSKETGEQLHFDSMREAAHAVDVNPSTISNAVTCGWCIKGYFWDKDGDGNE